MPTDATSRGLSALAGFGLFLTCIVLSYLNSTTSAYLWSAIYIGALIVTALAMAAKWAAALGVETSLAVAADKVASVVPWIALYFLGIQALHYNRDGLDGFMACIAILSLVFVIGFGIADSIASFAGKKYQEARSFAAQGLSSAGASLSSDRR